MIQLVERGAIHLWSEGLGVPGRPALLISGAGAHAAFWPDAFCHLLVEGGLFVIRFDHRDIGYSTHGRADYYYSVRSFVAANPCCKRVCMAPSTTAIGDGIPRSAAHTWKAGVSWDPCHGNIVRPH